MERKMSFVLLVCALAATAARADLYNFECITNNSAVDAAIGESQFSVLVTSGGTTQDGREQVLFEFQNAGPAASSITDVYFYDGALLDYGDVSLMPSGGVSYSEGADPGSLPGWPQPEIYATRVFSADSLPAVQPNGINPGESLGVLFALASGTTFQDVINGLNGGITDPMTAGNITIGIRAQGFADGGSESFVHAPLPGAVLLGLLGLGVAGLKLRKLV